LRGLPNLQLLNTSCTEVTDKGLSVFLSNHTLQMLNVCADR
jgi:hypothetical protein